MYMASAGAASSVVAWMRAARDAAVLLQRALSAGVPAADKAAWWTAFSPDGALLLIHDAECDACSTMGMPARRHPIRRLLRSCDDIRPRSRRRASDDRKRIAVRAEDLVVSICGV